VGVEAGGADLNRFSSRPLVNLLATCMQPRLFYRWKSFWLGMLVLGFLCFAWIRSMGYRDSIEWGSPSGAWIGFVNVGGRVTAVRIAHVPTGIPLLSGTRFETVAVEPSARFFPKAFQFEPSGAVARISASHWLLILLFGAPFSGFLAWRGRKQKRAQAVTLQ
jgi:hypothetical protein